MKPFEIIEKLFYGIIIIIDYKGKGNSNSNSNNKDGKSNSNSISSSIENNSKAATIQLYKRGTSYPSKTKIITLEKINTNSISDITISIMYDDESVSLLPDGENR